MELLVCFAVACIQAAIADHFKMFLRDMPDQTFDEVHNRDRFLYIFIIFVSIVMKVTIEPSYLSILEVAITGRPR